jgi:hypothetical protein
MEVIKKEILEFIRKNIIFVKKTNHIYDSDFVFSSRVIRTEHFYSEGKPIYKWQKKFNDHLYIYGNPFPSYCF